MDVVPKNYVEKEKEEKLEEESFVSLVSNTLKSFSKDLLHKEL